MYNLHPLKETLEELVSLDTLNQHDKTRVVVSAVNVQNTELTSFDNAQGLVFDHILASGSIAPSFPMTQIDGQFYWDGGLVSNTPLAQAINCLEELEPENPDIRHEIIVVELFSREVPLPTNMIEVFNRVAQIPFTSRLDIDRKLFAKFNRYIDLIHEIDQALPSDQDAIRNKPGYAELMEHKKIDALTVITSQLPLKSSNAGDFSPATLSLRIETGYQDAIKQEIGKPQLV